MSQAKILQEKAEMFERRAESATDPISKQHYKEMAAHYRSLAAEHLDVGRDEPQDRLDRILDQPLLRRRLGSRLLEGSAAALHLPRGRHQ